MEFDIGLFFEKKKVEKIQFSLKYDQNNGRLHGPTHIYDQISLRSSANENIAGRICRKNQDTHLCSMS